MAASKCLLFTTPYAGSAEAAAAPDGGARAWCRYEGEWVDDMMTGRGFKVWADGRRYDGEWFENRCNGRGVLTYKDGRRYEVRAARARTAAPRGAADVSRGTACGENTVRVSGTRVR
jgi:hypothetical protein